MIFEQIWSPGEDRDVWGIGSTTESCLFSNCIATNRLFLVREKQPGTSKPFGSNPSPITGSVVLVQEDTFPYDALLCRDDQHWARFQCQLVVVNNSVLPNSILGLRVWLAAPDGSWADVHARVSVPAQLPISLPPVSTIRLDAALYMPVAEGGSDRKQRMQCAMNAIHPERRLRVKVCTLNQHEFQFDVVASPLQVDPLMRAA